MKHSKLSMTIAAAMVFLASCNKSGSNTDPGSSSMQFQLKVTNPLVMVNKLTAGSILWTSGSAAATEVKLEAKKGTSEIEYKSSAASQIDLFASVIASLGNISIPAGTYTEVEFKITLNQNGPNAAMELNGQYTNGTGGVTPVVFSLNSLFLLKAEQSNVNVTGNSSITSLTTLDLSFVSSGITQALLNSAAVTSGKIVISASSNVNLYNIIINNLQQFHHVDVSHH
jgi:peptidyl-tRNA hydrolase